MGNLTQPELIQESEKYLLEQEQVECPVLHHFGPGIYIREVHLKEGIFALGHKQKFEHLNVVLKGAVSFIKDNGELGIIAAPAIFTSKPGRKFGFILQDTVWLNIYSTEETDIDKLEATFLDKSPAWEEHIKKTAEYQRSLHNEDRIDFFRMLKEMGLSEKEVRRQSENKDDQIEMPDNTIPKTTVRDSFIEGKGIFLSYPVKVNEVIGYGRIYGKRTPIGRYTNHSKTPNARFIMDKDNNVLLMALKDINGCVGGDQGEEITVNYRDFINVLKIRG